MRPSGSRLVAVIATVSLALALCACGVPISGSPRAISKSKVPRPPAAGTTTTAPADYVSVTIMLLHAGTNAPAPVLRFTPQQSDRLQTALTDLMQGPESGELLDGKTTAIPPSTRLIGVSPNPVVTPGVSPGSPVIVNLSSEFATINGLDQVLAVEQVVFTVSCDLTQTTRVLFEVEGFAQSVPILNGGLVNRAVTAADYEPTGETLDCTSAS